MKLAHDIIIRPVITEAAMDLMAAKTYVFEVQKNATKPEIAKAVEEVFTTTECSEVTTLSNRPLTGLSTAPTLME